MTTTGRAGRRSRVALLRGALLAGLALVLALAGGCSCRKPTDEERLHDALDVSLVHFYLAAKLALDPDATTKEAAEARASLKRVLAVRDGEPLSASDAKTIAVSLWELRARGKEALAKGKRDVPPPILAGLLEARGGKVALAREVLDADTEHAVLLVSYTVAKLHPKSPVPIPEPLLLYEARSTDADLLSLPSLGGPVRGIKAYTYGMAGYCDLGTHESDLLDGVEPLDAKALAKDLERLTGAPLPVRQRDARDFGLVPRMLGNGALVICWIEKDERQRLRVPLRRFLDDAETMGVKGPETEVLRGFLDCEEGRVDEGRKRLRAAAEQLPGEDAIKEIDAHCGDKGGALEKALGTATVARAIGTAAIRRLVSSELLDSLGDSDLGKTARRFGETVATTLDAGKSAIPSMKDVDSVTRRARGWWPF